MPGPPVGRRTRSAALRPLAILRIAVLDPRGFVQRVRARKANALILGFDLVPAAIRRPVARRILAIAERQLRRRPGSSRTAVIAFIAGHAAGPAQAAAELGRQLGTSPETAAPARRRIAALALDNGLRDAAADIVASMPNDRAATLEVVRARLDFDAGRYRDALAHAARAERLGLVVPMVPVVRARLASLEDGGSPDLGRPNRRRRVASPVPGRILHLASSSLPYKQVGYTLRLEAVAQCQMAAGLDPRVATRAGFPRTEGVLDAPRDQLVHGVRYYRLAPTFGETMLHDRLIRETARAGLALANRLRPAALQPASNHLQAQAALAVGREIGVPVVYEVRGFLEETWLSRPGQVEATALETDHYVLNRDAETRAILAADAVVTLSATMRDQIVARGGDPERIVIVPNAVDLARFEPMARDESLAGRLGMQPNEAVVGYISSFSRYEGIPYLLEAAARLRSSGRRLRVLLVGDGDALPVIQETASRLGLDDGTLVMPGRVPHDTIRAYYSLIDAFVVPRTAHRVSQLVTPLKPYEAMAMERAVVVSDLPALREIVTPGETGLTFRTGDVDDLVEVLGRLLDDAGLRKRLGRQAREWIVAERTWARNGARYRQLFDRLGVT